MQSGKANGADNPFETRLKRLLCCPLDRRNGIKPEMSGRRPGGRTRRLGSPFSAPLPFVPLFFCYGHTLFDRSR
ncbi:hypothetical protein HPP92_004261 [Vanilla planifolia]|uniref:Uncharacterized protein n=1 Tax=Vanilla planifolia TaxID=51239 RepID=A0A835VJQ6_VANPL|nr:hypothetical protein HPP92_004261 [Vanilla planifolia]